MTGYYTEYGCLWGKHSSQEYKKFITCWIQKLSCIIHYHFRQCNCAYTHLHSCQNYGMSFFFSFQQNIPHQTVELLCRKWNSIKKMSLLSTCTHMY